MKNISTAQRKTLREFLDERMARYSSVARALGISAPHLNALMNGTRPVTEDNAAKLAELFDVPASTFLPETDGGEG